jgi:ABC transporter substrate binding protein (PQQ-dependent alcohol dehydrogenase system)
MMMNPLTYLALFGFILAGLDTSALADSLNIGILYAEQKIESPATLSGLRPVPGDQGLRGAELAMVDNQETGQFTRDRFVLSQMISPTGKSLADRLSAMADALPDFIVVNAPADELLKIADLPAMKQKIIFNIAVRDEAVREENCRANVLHTIPSRAMLTDALAQFLLVKKWTNILLFPGPRANDAAYADAVRMSATKFGLALVAEKPWSLEGDMRESAATEIPLITQGNDYDVVVIADENNDFGPLIAYNTDLPRPVVGTHGLVATGWSDIIEPWGAVQLQNRFVKLSGRGMTEIDFAAWLATRIVGEAVTRTKSSDAGKLRSFMLSEDLNMAAFKGRGVTFRNWNGQMRQPIHLVTKETQVAVAPFEAFLHETNDLDTLGRDKPETACTKFGEGK